MEDRQNNISAKNDDLEVKKTRPDPPDGGWGWVVVLASFVISVITDGIVYSFGIFYIELLDYYKGGKGETAWIGSLLPGVTLLVGPISSMLTNTYGYRVTTIAGSIIATTGFILSVFSPNIQFLYFSFGILPGLGFGLMYVPSIVIVGYYFDNKRAFATGLAVCGSGIGAFIFNLLAKLLIDSYGWRGALLIEAGIAFNCVLCGAMFLPLVSQSGSADETVAVEIEEIIRDRSSPQEISLHRSYASSSDLRFSDNSLNKPSETTRIWGCITVCSRLKTTLKKICDPSLLKDPIFLMFAVSNFCTSVGFNMPFIYLPDLALSNGFSMDHAQWLVSAVGIANTAGRLVFGLLADRQFVNRLLMYNIALIVCGVATGLCPFCPNVPLLMISASVFGVCIGVYVSLTSIVLVDLLGLAMLTDSFGILMMFNGIATLIGPPIAGWLYDGTGSYHLSFVAEGTIIAVSGIMLYFIPGVRRCLKSKGRKTTSHEDDVTIERNGETNRENL